MVVGVGVQKLRSFGEGRDDDESDGVTDSGVSEGMLLYVYQ